MRKDAADLLARFPGPVVLYPSGYRYAGFTVIGFVFVAVGWADVALGHLAIGWFLIVSFGAGAVAAAATLLPGAHALKLDGDGLEFTVWFRHGKIRWQDATGFTMMPLSAMHTVVLFNLSFRKAKPIEAYLERAFARGRNAAVPDTYGLRPEDLIVLLTRWRERAVHAG